MRGIVGRGADARFDPTSRADSAEGLVGLLGGLVDEGLVDVGDHTTTGDGRLDEGVELLVTTDGELKVAGGDALHLLRSEREGVGGSANRRSCPRRDWIEKKIQTRSCRRV